MPTNLLQHKPAVSQGDPNLAAINTMVNGLKNKARQNGAGLVDASVGKNMLALESMGHAELTILQSEIENLNTGMESILNDVTSQMGSSVKEMFSGMQRDAAVAAAMFGTDIKTFLKQSVDRADPQKENTSFIMPSGGDMSYDRWKPALEAYDEKENQNAVTYSVAYNMFAARQDVFAETLFPTVVVTPDQIGFSVAIRINSVYQDLRRQISGDLDKFEKRNIIQAVIDPSIFNSDNTKVVPVYRTESAKYFVPTNKMAPTTTTVGDEAVTTSALSFGKKFSLIAISQTEALLATGLMDTSDALDSAIVLRSVVMEVGADVFEFDVSKLPFSVFNKSTQGNYRQLQLNFSTDSVRFNRTKKTVSAAEPTVVTDAIIGDHTVSLAFSAFGNINQELGDTELNTGAVSVHQILDGQNQVVDLTTGSGLAIVEAFANAKLLGYRLDAQRTNSNIRQRGQLLDTTFYNQIYAVPLRSPMTILRPTGHGDENDSADLAALITATHIRTTNDAVATLLDAASFLRSYIAEKESFETQPKILGVARDLVTAQYRYHNLDVTDSIQSLETLDKVQNIQAVLTTIIRDYVASVYRDSGYQAAADALAGGQAAKPTVIIATDPYIAGYLTKDGDTRLLGSEFDKVRVVSTLNKNMRGKLFVTFGDFSSGKEGVPNPMHFGNMAWKPEMTLMLPIPRNGAYNKELTVQPSYLHIVNLPILIEMDVSGISETAAGLVAIPTQEQNP